MKLSSTHSVYIIQLNLDKRAMGKWEICINGLPEMSLRAFSCSKPQGLTGDSSDEESEGLLLKRKYIEKNTKIEIN